MFPAAYTLTALVCFFIILFQKNPLRAWHLPVVAISVMGVYARDLVEPILKNLQLISWYDWTVSAMLILVIARIFQVVSPYASAVFATGALANQTVILANGGMLYDAHAWGGYFIAPKGFYIPMGEDTVGDWWGDWIWVGDALVSPGDVLILLGMWIFVFCYFASSGKEKSPAS